MCFFPEAFSGSIICLLGFNTKALGATKTKKLLSTKINPKVHPFEIGIIYHKCGSCVEMFLKNSISLRITGLQTPKNFRSRLILRDGISFVRPCRCPTKITWTQKEPSLNGCPFLTLFVGPKLSRGTQVTQVTKPESGRWLVFLRVRY